MAQDGVPLDDGQTSPQPRLPDPLEQIELLRRMGADVSEIEHLAEQETIDQLWEDTHNQIAAQYRFIGLLAGYPKGSDRRDPEHPEVVAARDAVKTAFESFFGIDLRQAADDMMAQARADKAAILRDAPHMERLLEEILPELGPDGRPVSGHSTRWNNAIHGSGVDLVNGLINREVDLRTWVPAAEPHLVRGVFQTNHPNTPEMLGRTHRLAGLVQEQRRLSAEADVQPYRSFIQGLAAVWDSLTQFYDQVMHEIGLGYSMLAANRVAAAIWQEGHLGVIAGAISLAFAGAGLTLVVARPIFNQAVRNAISVVPSVPRMQGAVAGAVMNIQISITTRSAIGSFDVAPRYFYERRVETPTDLNTAERNIYDLGNQGTTRPDVDQGTRTRPDGDRADWFDENGHLRREHRGKDPGLDMSELRRIIGDEDLGIAADPDALGQLARETRIGVVSAYENYFGTGVTNATNGMNMSKPITLQTYPPPYQIIQWVRANPAGERIVGGNYYQPNSNPSTSPSELGINSVGRAQEIIDLSQTRGVALQGYGRAVPDNWTFDGGVYPNAVRQTSGGPLQWHIPHQYISQMHGEMTGVTWRDLPGNTAIERLEGSGLRWETVNGREQWVYDGPPMDSLDNGQAR